VHKPHHHDKVADLSGDRMNPPPDKNTAEQKKRAEFNMSKSVDAGVCAVTDEPQLMLTAGPSAMVYGAPQPAMYGTYPPSGMPGYGMPMQQ